MYQTWHIDLLHKYNSETSICFASAELEKWATYKHDVNPTLFDIAMLTY